jgi:phosphoenolpyruvate-protein kinase (PTS system EI component)
VAATQAAWEAYLTAPDRANAAIAEANDQLDASLLACITQAPDAAAE